ncbi:unnamed protein product [Didymodactylos carnosus]|nr:unnamed protein product [Didymodactylos carnosus]CAF3757071.1 unnamed protein product [Didymodactylos carnosus]
MYYNRYNNMSENEKDRMCNGENLRQTLKQLATAEQRNNEASLKRHLTNSSEIITTNDDGEIEGDMDGFQINTYNRNNKRMNRNNNDSNNDKDERYSATRTYTNPNVKDNRNKQQQRNENNLNNTSDQQYQIPNTTTNQNGIRISKHAIDYATEYHYTPFKIQCEPKLKNQKNAAKLVCEILNYVKSDFTKLNPVYSKPLLFDMWWIDGSGYLQMIIKSIELYVFLCNKERYPQELMNMKLTAHPPQHLPPQLTAIIKWLKNSVTLEDLNEELKIKYKSIFNTEEMMGTANDRNRHVRIEMCDRNEFISLVNGG